MQDYLNAGTGDPCAGQERAIPEPSDFLNEKDSMIEENLGAADPMGSKKIYDKNLSNQTLTT